MEWPPMSAHPTSAVVPRQPRKIGESTFRSDKMGSCGKTCRRACWLNLDAHPAHDESEVSLRICSRDIEVTSFPNCCSRRPVSDARVSHSETATRDRRDYAERIGIEP